MPKINGCPASSYNMHQRQCTIDGMKDCPYNNKEDCRLYRDILKPMGRKLEENKLETKVEPSDLW